ncbi:MAG: mitochondrial fission ELM1 family protein [Dongiaceae bacterium]
MDYDASDTEWMTIVTETTQERVGTASPRVWLLLGNRAGDNAQVAALGEALGWPVEIKRLSFNALHHNRNLFLGASRRTLDRAKSDKLEAPWPDLVIAAGRRSAPIARWIRRRSGGKTRLVHIGRPWAPAGWFDLIVTTPQYGMRWRPNVLVNAAPLHAMTPERLEDAAALWQPKLAHLPQPWTALLIGGPSDPYRFGPPEVRGLIDQAVAATRASGGSLLVTTSGRTPASVGPALEAWLGDVPHHLFLWRKDQSENPYYGYLALADRFIVTGDSVSMMTEATATGRPVAIYRPAERPRLIGKRAARVPPLRWLIDVGLLPHPRDIGAFCERLVASGRAYHLGDEPPIRNSPAPEDMGRAVERVRALFRAEG